MVEQRAWLKQAVGSRVLSDVESVLARFGALLPKLDTYIHENGMSSLLLCLYGTIPIAYNATTYNIPMEVWCPHMYPMVPPFGFVRPTSSMEVQPSKHVDANGQLYHPYLSTWHHRGTQSSLIEMLNVFASEFSLQPPVYSKYTSSSNSGRDRQRPPTYSSGDNLQHSQPNTMPDHRQQHPIRRPTPSHTHSMPNGVNGGSGSMDRTQLNNYSQTAIPSILNTQIPTSYSPSFHPPIDPAAMKLAHVKASVDTKLQSMFSKYNIEMTNSIQQLLADNKLLNEGDLSITSLQQSLADEEIQLKTLSTDLNARLSEVSNGVRVLKEMPLVSVDDMYQAPSIPYNQLFEAMADDIAIDDTIYYLGKALDKEQIDVATYMKHIRALTKEQFLRKALIKKIRTILRLRPI